MYKVFIAGSTGLVGTHLVEQCAAQSQISRVRALMRKPPTEPYPSNGKIVACVADPTTIALNSEWFAVDAVFCALGTTIAVAGSKENFRDIDFEYPLQIAKLAYARNCKHFLMVSSLGANAQSSVFYNKVKGELEDSVTAIGFESVTIVRPSLLLGHRPHFRLGEFLMAPLAKIAPKKWRAVQASRVAQALVESFIHHDKGLRYIENIELV